MMDTMELDGGAKYREVSNALRKEILAGKYAPGSRFPSLKMLCRRFGVSYLTAVKVQKSLKELGLVKSRNGAGTFVARRLTSIGLIVPMLKQSEIYPPICQEFSRLCLEKGVSIDFADISAIRSDKVHPVVVAAARRMASGGVSGVVFHPVDFGDDAAKTNREVLRIFKAADIPVVILDTDMAAEPGEDRFDFVGVDNFEIGRFAGRHVIERGAKKVAFVAYADMSDNVRRRLDGLLAAIAQKRGARFAGDSIYLRDYAALADKWRRRPPDAVVCSSDIAAANVLKLLRRIGKRCPQDILVTGVNDVELATLVSPTITTVRQPCAELAAATLETLFWRFDNPDKEKRRLMVAAELVVRESTLR
ncbi:MAG: substrate-binding domain-containing protein [Kiritimatiellae bacterium]|nr:substrate-binding domain-containing protein [Kiritimatiellia bacterium]